MHPDIERLLAHLAGDPDPRVAAHLVECEWCRSELDRLDALGSALVDLPEVGPRRDLWPEIERDARRHRRRRSRRRVALAAAMVVTVAGGVVATRLATGPKAKVETAAEVDDGTAVRELVSASHELEALLERPGLRSRVMGPRQAALIVALEDRIAEVDSVLAAEFGPRSRGAEVALWSERVRLLAALVQARGAPAAEPELQRAVLVQPREL